MTHLPQVLIDYVEYIQRLRHMRDRTLHDIQVLRDDLSVINELLKKDAKYTTVLCIIRTWADQQDERPDQNRLRELKEAMKRCVYQ